jgi:hypothetical protein
VAQATAPGLREGGILSSLLRTWQSEPAISPQESLAYLISAKFQMNVSHIALRLCLPEAEDAAKWGAP